MRVLPESHCKFYGPITLWADDLQEIFEVYSKFSSTFSFVADNIEYNDIDEFIKHRNMNPPKYICISGSGITTKLASDGFFARSLIRSGDSLPELGAYSRLDEILTRCERRPRLLNKVWFLIVLQSVFTGFPHFMSPTFEKYDQISSAVSLFLIVTVGLLIIKLLWGNNSLVVPAFKANKPTFFQQHKSAILLLIIGAIIAAIINKVSDRILPPPASPAQTQTLPRFPLSGFPQ
jgi:hypothetical protein